VTEEIHSLLLELTGPLEERRLAEASAGREQAAAAAAAIVGLLKNGGPAREQLSVDGGIVNVLLMKLGFIHEPIMWLSVPKYFWGIVAASHVWKEVGWNAIIYLAAITSIDPSLYEAAEIDGANRYQRMLYVTLPGIKSIVIILMIMNLGWILDAGFEVQYLLGNGVVVDWSQTIDIFVLKYGLQVGSYSLATAAGIFKTVVSVTLIFAANSIAKRFGEDRLV
jgi:putative aldouronate transport system permease protein